MRFTVRCLLAAGCALLSTAAVIQDDMAIQGNYLDFIVAPKQGGAIAEMHHKAAAGDLAGDNGLMQEGFGVGSFYVPNRRLNELWESIDTITDRPVIRYSYDCDGPNIKGLHVTRTLEAPPDQSSLRVTWKIENQGKEAQWVAPWVRNEAMPGGRVDEQDRVDAPTTSGILRASGAAFNPAARNWAAATDPTERVTVYSVFNAEHTHSFETFYEPDGNQCGYQAAFVPRMLEPGASWETTYRLNVVRGLSHIDFADDALAAQIDFRAPDKLEVLIAAAKTLPELHIKARIMAANGQVWKLDGKKFTADPSRVVRCTYTWTPPADGVYDFLAELSAGGKVFSLGQDTASPHGGIDTQFTVGNPGPHTMEPWTDAPLALDRAGKSITRSMAHQGNPLMWWAPSLEKVFREDVPKPSGSPEPTGRVSLARNEHESIQLVLRATPGKDLTELTVRVNDLVNRETKAVIPAANIQIYDVAYCPIRIPSHYEGPTGNWPDALPPAKQFNLRGGECHPIWITLYAPENTAPGRYAGMVEVSAPDLSPVELWLEATVFNFALPITPALKTDFGYWPEAAATQAHNAGFSGNVDELPGLYQQNAEAHRVTLRETIQLPAESARYESDLKEYAPRLDAALASGASSIAAPPTLLDAPEQLKQADAFVKARKLDKLAFCQIAPEPPAPSWPRVLERMQQWKDTAPSIPLMATTVGLEPFLPDGLDIWTVHLQMLDTAANKTILDRVHKGGEVWTYVNHCPSRPYGNFFVDFAGVEHRILFWQTWALGFRGFHYGCVNSAPLDQNVRENLLDITPANGNGFLVYPGPNGPVNSIRWEIIRDGIEDFDYLVLLRTRIRALEEAKADPALLKRAADAANLSALLPDLVNFSRDPKVLIDKRNAIARMIEELSKNAK